ncbi:putative membrane protein DUF2306 [Kribbella amoyensis]|uniref:Putative membrane protein DUF2306 n=1 Tax=Kribbella amoyensis TaxID=996641 RepID=A0A561BMN0_9ACTN|nr:DUF2306 domain-containing protein [Kribbella amoyensis]TWD80108.1 putative membrane protein DUF2306 [Kribbella amoyensis]
MTSTLDAPPPPTRSRPQRVWWRRPWIAPLMLAAAAFLAFSVPPYLTFDPANSRLEPPPGNDLYYPLLVAHVLFGTVAMTTACFQVWPAFRAKYRRGHRITGRIYVFAGVLPAGVLGLYIGWYTAAGPSVRVANLAGSALWLIVTVAGLRMARQRRYDEHRRWMSRSFALAMSIAFSRVINIASMIALTPRVDSTFGGNEELMRQTATSIGVWLSPLLLLMFADYLLDRRKYGARRPAGRQAPAAAR